jgi:hypothetical protein
LVTSVDSGDVLILTAAALSFVAAYVVGSGLHRQLLPRAVLQYIEHSGVAFGGGTRASACGDGHDCPTRSTMGRLSGCGAGGRMDTTEVPSGARGVTGAGGGRTKGGGRGRSKKAAYGRLEATEPDEARQEEVEHV